MLSVNAKVVRQWLTLTLTMSHRKKLPLPLTDLSISPSSLCVLVVVRVQHARTVEAVGRALLLRRPLGHLLQLRGRTGGRVVPVQAPHSGPCGVQRLAGRQDRLLGPQTGKVARLRL